VAPALALLTEHCRPQLEVLPLDKVACLILEKPVTIGQVDERGVALAALVRDESEARETLITVYSPTTFES
jgi:hypothetical protein